MANAKIAAVVNGNVVENIIVIETCAITAVREAMGYDFLIPVDDSVQIGDTYDAEKSIFLRDGVRVYPEKTNAERIAELEQAQSDTDAALMELAAMISGGEANG